MTEPLLDWRLLGERLHVARRRRGLTSAQVAERAGTTRVTISRLENVHKPAVSFDVLVRIAQVLGVSLNYLAGRKDEDTVVLPSTTTLVGAGA